MLEHSLFALISPVRDSSQLIPATVSEVSGHLSGRVICVRRPARTCAALLYNHHESRLCSAETIDRPKIRNLESVQNLHGACLLMRYVQLSEYVNYFRATIVRAANDCGIQHDRQQHLNLVVYS